MLGRLVDRFGEIGNPDGQLSIITSDHGEAFLEHGWRSHGVQIFEESVRIPLVIHWPQRVRPAILEAPVSLHDVLPTLLGLLDEWEQNHGWAGRNLAKAHALVGEDAIVGPVVIQRQTYERDGLVEPIPLSDLDGKTFGAAVEVYGEMFAIRDGNWRYIEALEETLSTRLYNLEADPRESRNLADEEPELVQRLSQLLMQWRIRHIAGPSTKPAGPSEADQQRLRALGYLDPVSAKSESPTLE
jgi:arylsulfatase A-like enzyme